MNEESRKEEVNRILPTISGGSWKRRAGIGDFGKGCSNLEDRDLARNHSETVNGQEGETQNEIAGESEIGETSMSNLGGAGVRRYRPIRKCISHR